MKKSHLLLNYSKPLNFVRFVAIYLKNNDFKGSWRIRNAFLALERLLLKLGMDAPCICPTVYGFYLRINPSLDSYQRTIFETGTYEPGTLALFEVVLRPDDIVLDVGANIGLMSLTAAKLVGPDGAVYAFEPHPEMYSKLLGNIELNNVDQIVPVNVALGCNPGIRQIYSRPDVNIGASSLVSASGSVPAGFASVATLDQFMEAARLDRVRLAKIDVEGFEYEVLKGAEITLTSGKIDILCIEFDDEMPRNSAEISMADIHSYVLESGLYAAFRLADTKFADACTLVELANLADVVRHDNIIYILKSLVPTLPRTLLR